GGEACHVEAGTEGPALARQHDRAHALVRSKLGACFDDAVEHRRIERVHLVGADQPDVRHAVPEFDRNPVLHWSFSDLSHCRRRRFTSSRGTGPCDPCLVDRGHISTAMARCTSAKLQSSGRRSSSARTSALTSTLSALLIGSPSATRLVLHTPRR